MPFERGRRRRDAVDLDVFRQRLLPETDREHGDVGGLHRQQRVRELGIGRVGAVGHEHETGQRQTRQLLPRAIERRADSRLGAGERELSGRRQALRRRREAEAAQHEPARKRLQDVGVGRREVQFGERAARLAVDVGNLHAARVVHEHAEEVLLWDGRLDDEHRPEKARQDEQQGGKPDGREDGAVPRIALAARAPVGQDRDDDGGDDDGGGNERTGRGDEPEIALLKDNRPVIEQQPKDSIEHACPPWPENRAGPGVDCITARGAIRQLNRSASLSGRRFRTSFAKGRLRAFLKLIPSMTTAGAW